MNILDKISQSFPQINETNRNYVLGGILLFIVLFDYFLVMRPQIAQLTKLNPEIKVVSNDLKRVKEELQNLATYQSQISGLKKKIQGMDQLIRTRDQVPLILEAISGIATKNRVRINQLMPLPDTQELILKSKEGKYYSLPILVEMRSGYHAFARFLNNLENSEVSLKVNRFSIEGIDSDTMNHVIKLTVDATVLDSGLDGEAKK